MTASNKITILLADEDSLRRDGLAAVLQGTEQHEIVAHSVPMANRRWSASGRCVRK